MLSRHRALANNLPGFELNFSDRRAAVDTCAFVQVPVNELETLRVGIGIVRIRALNTVPRHGGAGTVAHRRLRSGSDARRWRPRNVQPERRDDEGPPPSACS